MALLTDYTGLITSEHADKPKFVAFLSALVQPFVDEINLANSLPALFDLDAATGAQLDVVGQWVGLSRTLKVPISGVYFAFDTNGLGFDQGIWFNSEEAADGVITMDDGTYRLMLYAKILVNTWDGTLGGANEGLLNIFPMASVILIDNMDMTETIIVSGTAPSVLFQQLVQQGYIQLKPGAVGLITQASNILPDGGNGGVYEMLFFDDAGFTPDIGTGME